MTRTLLAACLLAVAVTAHAADDPEVATLKAHTAGWISATSYAGNDACARIHAAIAALPTTGGVVDARGFTGPQPCATNPVGDFTKPFAVLLGATTFQARVSWSFGKGSIRNDIGQFIVGMGPEITIVQPAPQFSGAAVIQIRPGGAADTIVSNASFSGLTIDMNNVSNQTAIEILSASNIPAIHDINVKNQNGRFVHIAPASTSATIPEGITFHDWFFYAKPPKVAPGIVIENTNETVFRDGKLLGIDEEADKQVGVLILAARPVVPPINTSSEGVQFLNSSIAFYDVGIRIGSTGPWLAPRSNAFIGLTMEALGVAFDLAGYHDAKGSYPTTFNHLLATRYLTSVKTHVRLDDAQYNLIEENAVNGMGAGAYVYTGRSAYNTTIRTYTTADKSDVSDAGKDNVFLGELAGTGLHIGRGGRDVTGATLSLDAGTHGNPALLWRRNGAIAAMTQVSDAFGPEELVTSVGPQYFRLDRAGHATVPSIRSEAGVYGDGGGLKHRRVSTGTVGAGADVAVRLSWTNPFRDSNYTLTATVAGAAGQRGLRVLHVESVEPGSAVVWVRNDSDHPLSGLLHCIAMHD
jgi:hypothetical protein